MSELFHANVPVTFVTDIGVIRCLTQSNVRTLGEIEIPDCYLSLLLDHGADLQYNASSRAMRYGFRPRHRVPFSQLARMSRDFGLILHSVDLPLLTRVDHAHQRFFELLLNVDLVKDRDACFTALVRGRFGNYFL